jgi:multiple sugar transport system substrate-binding protein
MKKYLTYVLAIVFLIFLASTITFAAGEKLTVWVGGHVVEQEETWKEIIADFTKQTGIDVEYQLIGFEVYYDKLVTAYTAGQGPDICFADLGGWVPTFAAQGWLEPMDDMLATTKTTEQIWPNLWPTVTYQGKRYGLPWYTDCRLLLYNTKMFTDAGLDPNKPPITWDDLLATAQKLTDESKKIYGYGVTGAKSETATLAYMIYLYGAGGEFLTGDYGKAAFNTPEGLAALKFYAELFTKYKVSPPGTPSYTEDDYRTMMSQNQVAMAIGGPWSFPLIEMANPKIKGNYTVATHPYKTTPASVLGGWASVIAKTSTQKEAAWKFVDFITSYEVWMKWIEKHGGPMPTRQDVCKDAPAFKTDPKWQIIFETFPHAKVRPPIPQYPQISDQIQTMIQDVLTGKATPEDAIKKAEEEVNKLLAK